MSSTDVLASSFLVLSLLYGGVVVYLYNWAYRRIRKRIGLGHSDTLCDIDRRIDELLAKERRLDAIVNDCSFSEN